MAFLDLRRGSLTPVDFYAQIFELASNLRPGETLEVMTDCQRFDLYIAMENRGFENQVKAIAGNGWQIIFRKIASEDDELKDDV